MLLCFIYLAYTNRGGFRGKAKIALGLYRVHLVLSWPWNPIFFGADNFTPFTILMATLWGIAATTARCFFVINTTAGLLMFPYMSSSTIATVIGR
ncbi:hypothetical protein CAPTEDRAFT_118383 [Capitella teleta]|uniref:Uncharacterized protein n=1 Tax=Capitella teleta TaxID=283909 RepID=R7UAN6_CAPTE|nr:hypothetical protein CAPTEDRAFT_118383 [Capitella teleta]|eukprot:ELU03029.1 hypothetical protein CAPTEDRAFT_118383 [Capitella teleta]